MHDIPQIYDIAKTLYNKLIKYTNEMYEFIKEDYNVPKEELLIELDHFVQAILFRVALADDRLLDVELNFIKDIVDTDDLFKEHGISYLKVLSNEEKEMLVDKCNKVLEIVPEFIKLSVLCDKKTDEMMIVINPTYCQKVFDYLKRVACYLKFIDGNVEIVEDKISKSVLSSVVAYYKKKYVKYAPSRKK